MQKNANAAFLEQTVCLWKFICVCTTAETVLQRTPATEPRFEPTVHT